MNVPLDGRTTADDVLQGRSMAGNRVLVTGCGAEIGFEAARALAHHGAHVVLACRTRASAEQTAARRTTSGEHWRRRAEHLAATNPTPV